MRSNIGRIGLIAIFFTSVGWLIASTRSSAVAETGLAPLVALPDYLKATVDPVSGVAMTRITNPGPNPDGRQNCRELHCTHRYSSSQAWNADQSMLLIANGCGGMCFLDGQTYVPLFRRRWIGECEWHPKDPNLMICVAGRSIVLWAPRSGREEVIHTATAYRELRFGPSKGNPTLDGSRIVVRATTADGKFDAFVFDLKSRRTLPVIHLADLPGKNSFCTISSLGTYVLCVQDQAGDIESTFIFSSEGKLLQTWPEHHRPGHGDMAVDDAGDEVYVGISKSDPDRYQVIKRRLKDGVVTSLAPYGEGQHVSVRATVRPQWAFVSYAGHPAEVASHPEWAPFAQEVVALPLGGGGIARRIAETHNAPHDYWSETHASPSPDGSQVIWSSNWGNPGGPVYDFVTRLPTSGLFLNPTVMESAETR